MHIVFTDLDGTLLDQDTYSYDESMEGINILREKNIPLILCSSKTDPEMRLIHDELCLSTPYIFENGAGIRFHCGGKKEKDSVEITGKNNNELKRFLTLLKRKINKEIKTIHDMDIHEIAGLTGLPGNKAELARRRIGSLPFIIIGMDDIDSAYLDNLNAVLKGHDLAVTRGGRFFHLSSANADKGSAVKRVIDYYKSEYHGDVVKSIGIGDSHNDIAMLMAVDIPFLVRRRDGSAIDHDISNISVTEKAGPAGFTEAVKKVF